MKRFFKLGMVSVLAILLCSLFVACGGSSSDSNSSDSANGEVYTIATDTTFAPFEFEDAQGKRVGIDVEVLDAIAQEQGFQYELQALGFDAAVTALESGQVDGVIAGMSITDDRKEKFDFSEPYFESGVVCAVMNNSDIDSYEGLKGKNVAVKTGTEGSTYAESIKDQYGFNITTFQDSANMYEDVKAGNSVACFEDYPVIGYAINQGQPFKMIGGLQQGSDYGFAVQKDNEKGKKLLEMFNAGLNAVKDDGTYDQIVNQYITQ